MGLRLISFQSSFVAEMSRHALWCIINFCPAETSMKKSNKNSFSFLRKSVQHFIDIGWIGWVTIQQIDDFFRIYWRKSTPQMPQRFYAPYFSRLPPSIYSLPHKSHDPSVNYRTTQAGRGKNLKTPSVSLIGAWPPLTLPTHLFSLSKPNSSLSWKWLLMFDTNISFLE